MTSLWPFSAPRIVLTLLALCLAIGVTAQTLPPLRTVSGASVMSQADPAARITVRPKATYVGALRFVLFDVADCEIHVFVDAGADKRVRRLYWVHFEAYLPQHPTLRYAPHRSDAQVQLAGRPFYQRARFGSAVDVPREGSDAAQVYALLQRQGYRLPEETVNVTYKHFLDADMRKELLLMVLQDMAHLDVRFNDLVKDGQLQATRWAPIAERLLDEAATVFDIRFAARPEP